MLRSDALVGYTVTDLLGRGGSSDVYRVVDAAGRLGALKVLRADSASNSVTRERFHNEFRLTSTLHHPHIVSAVDHGELDDGRMWMLMGYVDATSAATLVPARHSEPRLATFVHVAAQIADALDYAHGQQIIHRDVKPANILVTQDDYVHSWLTDFGIAQLLDDSAPLAANGRVRGSLHYASPELLQGQQLSVATDEYAFACTLVEMLTGAPPFTGSTPFAITQAHLRTPPPRLDRRRDWIPSALNSVFAKALAKDPAQRYRTCGDLVTVVCASLRGIEPSTR